MIFNPYKRVEELNELLKKKVLGYMKDPGHYKKIRLLYKMDNYIQRFLGEIQKEIRRLEAIRYPEDDGTAAKGEE
jgi:hypothetical protein